MKKTLRSKLQLDAPGWDTHHLKAVRMTQLMPSNRMILLYTINFWICKLQWLSPMTIIHQDKAIEIWWSPNQLEGYARPASRFVSRFVQHPWKKQKWSLVIVLWIECYQAKSMALINIICPPSLFLTPECISSELASTFCVLHSCLCIIFQKMRGVWMSEQVQLVFTACIYIFWSHKNMTLIVSSASSTFRPFSTHSAIRLNCTCATS